MELDLLNEKDIGSIMRRKLGTNDFVVKNWSLDRVESTNGYLGQYYKVRVVCSLPNGNHEKFVFFAKTMPSRNSPQYDFAVKSDAFKREIIFYEDLVKRMGKGEGRKWIVDCYLGKADSIIVLEDAIVDGFGMPDKFVPFDYDDCVAMFYPMAKLHSRSVVLDEKLRNSGQSLDQVYGDVLKEAMYPNEDRMGRNLIAPGIQGACGMINLMDGLDDSSKKRIKNVIADWAWRLPKLLHTSKKYRNVICHRDPWANNMLIKRDTTSGRVIDFYLIDFQFVHYLPPAVDFMLGLYLTTTRNTRDENFEKFTKIYHDLVREELRREKLDVDECKLGWKSFCESCDYYRPFAIIYTTISQQIIMLDEHSADKYFTKSPELLDRALWGTGREQLVCPIFANNRRYRDRISENIMEIYENLDKFENWRYEDY